MDGLGAVNVLPTKHGIETVHDAETIHDTNSMEHLSHESMEKQTQAIAAFSMEQGTHTHTTKYASKNQ